MEMNLDRLELLETGAVVLGRVGAALVLGAAGYQASIVAAGEDGLAGDAAFELFLQRRQLAGEIGILPFGRRVSLNSMPGRSVKAVSRSLPSAMVSPSRMTGRALLAVSPKRSKRLSGIAGGLVLDRAAGRLQRRGRAPSSESTSRRQRQRADGIAAAGF